MIDRSKSEKCKNIATTVAKALVIMVSIVCAGLFLGQFCTNWINYFIQAVKSGHYINHSLSVYEFIGYMLSLYIMTLPFRFSFSIIKTDKEIDDHASE